MKQTTKYLGLVMVLTVLALGMGNGLVDTAEATKADGSPGSVTPKSYGSSTSNVVCGDKLCSEIQENSQG